MCLATLSPYELGEPNSKEAIPYLVHFLIEGEENEKRLAASAVTKLAAHFPEQCMVTYPYLIHNLNSEGSQVRQYTLKALKSLSVGMGMIMDLDVSVLRKTLMDDPKDYNRSLAEELLAKWNFENTEYQETNQFGDHCFPEGATRKVIEKQR